MIVLGIHDGHNAAVCLMSQGAVLAAHQEERLSRVKNEAGFPRRALASVMAIAGVRADQIERVAMAGRMQHRPPSSPQNQRLNYKRACDLTMRWRHVLKGGLVDQVRQERLMQGRARQVRELGLAAPLEFIDHHRCHAAAAYYGWGRLSEEVLVLTLDGAGDRLCATVNIGREGRLVRVAQVPETSSLGLVWANVTALAGMTAVEHEYKLMGLAPYASAAAAERVSKRFGELFGFEQPGLTWRFNYGAPPATRCYEFVRELLEFERFDAIAAGLQLFTERFVCSWVRNCIRALKVRRVAMGGGVFMNVKVNKAVMELSEVEDLFVLPSCGDETNALGACYAVSAQARVRTHPLGEMYWGPRFDENEIAAAVRAHRFGAPVAITESGHIEEEIALLLARGEIVGRFAGGEEFGARSLGNRALLAPPRAPESVRLLNDMIKQRDFWMPFALSILKERAHEYVRNPRQLSSAYMILAFDTLAAGRQFIAGLHPRDFTVRPQIVTSSDNPAYHRLLRAYERLTGDGAIVNTSLNLHGEPLVSTPADALRLFELSGLRHLALGNLLISKQGILPVHAGAENRA
jgi:carbamoyltransferase